MHISKIFTVVVGRRITDEVDLLIIQSKIHWRMSTSKTGLARSCCHRHGICNTTGAFR
jgi:hypothetical protein